MSARTYRVPLERARCGGRNYLRPGDPCYVRAGGADRTGFRARVVRIVAVETVELKPKLVAVEVDVVVGRLSDDRKPQRKAGTYRTVPLERLERRRPLEDA